MPSLPRVLLAEPDAAFRARLNRAAAELADINLHPDFLSARRSLLAQPYDWVIANLQLQAYNGLHLLHLASRADPLPRFIVYADRPDLRLVREAQRAGAFYESRDCVHRAVAAYLRGTLPVRDRRDAAAFDRRAIFRGSRRCRDLTAE